MHPLPKVDEHTARLLRKVGIGRRIEFDEGHLSLAYRRFGGKGIVLAGALEHEPVRLWVEDRQWCRWIDPLLAIAEPAYLPPELNEALAAWTLDSIGRGLQGLTDPAHCPWPNGTSLQRADVEPQFGWCVQAQCGGRRIDALLLEAPYGWLDALADQLAPCPCEPASDISVRVSLVAGWSSIPHSLAKSLCVGDALLLRHAYRVAQREFGLFTTRPVARLAYDEAGVFTIEDAMEAFDDWLDVEPAMPAPDNGAARDTLVTVVAEVCGFDVHASALAALKPGDILTGQARPDEFVTLKVGGRSIARATLLDIDGRLAAKIETL
jgi:type III secretion protein Q